MPSVRHLIALENHLPASETSLVIKAFRQDIVFWKEFCSYDNFQKLEDNAGNQVKLWSPANMALLLAGFQLDKDNFSEEGIDPKLVTSGDIDRKYLSAYESTTENIWNTSFTLAEIAFLAITILRKYWLIQDWETVFRDFSLKGFFTSQFLFTWRAVLAVLFGMVKEKKSFLKALIQQELPDPQPILDLISYIINCQPETDDEKAVLVDDLRQFISDSAFITWLRVLRQSGNVELTRILGKQNTDLFSDRNEIILEVNSTHDFYAFISSAINNFDLATLAFLQSDEQKVADHLKKISMVIHHLTGGINLLAQGLNSIESYPNNILIEDTDEYFDANGFLENLLVKDKVADQDLIILENHPEMYEYPLVKIRQGKRLLSRGEFEEGTQLARAASSEICRILKHHEPIFIPRFLWSWNPGTLIEDLAKMGLPREASECIKLAINETPLVHELYEIATGIFMQLGDLDTAYGYSLTLSLMSPNRGSSHRLFAEVCESIGDWERGFEERQKVLSYVAPPLLDDWLKFANSALRVNQASLTIDACEVALKENPGCALAFYYAAIARNKLGNNEEALNDFRRAINLDPNLVDAWIRMGNLYNENNQPQQMLSCLQEALLSNSESYLLNRTISRVYLDRAVYQEAVNFAQKASMIQPDNIDPIIVLVKALYGLEEMDQAESVIQIALNKWGKQPELNKLLIKIYLYSGRYDQALSNIDPEFIDRDQEMALLYVEALHGDPEDALWNESTPNDREGEIIKTVLDRAIENRIEDIKPYIIQAEINIGNHQYEDAYHLYQKAGEYISVSDSRTKWRMQVGLGISALNAGKIDVALVALQEALVLHPDHLQLLQTITDAYQQADLLDNALETARIARMQDESNPKIHAWYSQQMHELQHMTEAIESIKQAITLNPGNLNYLLTLVDLYIENKEFGLAEENLRNVNGELSGDDYRKVAQRYLTINKLAHAIEMLELAISNMESQSAIPYLELAGVYYQEGQYDDAVIVIERGLQEYDTDIALFMAKIAVYWRQNKIEDAIAFLESLLDKNDETVFVNSLLSEYDFIKNAISFVPELYSGDPRATVYFYLSLLYDAHRQINKSIDYAEKAYSSNPQEIDYLYLVSSLKNGRNSLDDISYVNTEIGTWLIDNVSDEYKMASGNVMVDHVICLAGEITYEHGMTIEEPVNHILFQESLPVTERSLALKTCLDLLGGDYSRFDSLKSRLLPEITDAIDQYEIVSESGLSREISLANVLLAQKYLWLSMVAESLYLWDEAKKLSKYYLQFRSHEPLAHKRLLSLQINLAEKRKRLIHVGCLVHAPVDSYVSEADYKIFENNILNAKSVCSAGELKILGNRGVAAYKTTIKGLTWKDEEVTRCEAPGRIAYLREHGKSEKVENLAIRFNNNPEVLVELALTPSYVDAFYSSLVSRLELYSTHPICQAALALLKGNCGNYQAALDHINKSLSIWPDEYEWQASAADFAKKAGLITESITHWEFAHNLLPDNLIYTVHLAENYLISGQTQDAIDLLEEYIGDGVNIYQYWFFLALAYYRNQQLDKAKNCISKTKGFVANNRDVEFLRALILKQESQLDEALELVRDIYRQNKNDLEVIGLLVDLNLKTQHIHEALAVLDQIQVEPTDELNVIRVDLFYQVHGLVPAKMLLKDLMNEYPENIDFLTRMAQFQFESREYNEAILTAKEGLRIDPERTDLQLLLGRIYHANGQLDKAIDNYSQLIALSPADILLYLELADIYQERREDTRALELYREVIRISPDDPKAYYQAAMLLKSCKDYDGAETMLRKAAALSPNDVHIHRQLSGMIAMNLLHSPQEVIRKR